MWTQAKLWELFSPQKYYTLLKLYVNRQQFKIYVTLVSWHLILTQNVKVLGEPSMTRLLTAHTVANSYVTTLPHARIRSAFLRLVLRNDVLTEFTIQVRNNALVLSGRLHISWRHVENSPQFDLRNGSNFMPDILFEFLKWMRVIRVNFTFQCASLIKITGIKIWQSNWL